MDPVYFGREQTLAKHFILKNYLQSLAFKVLQGGWNTLSFVDGFSGPWKSKTNDGSDTSFMIALQVLKDAKDEIEQRTGVNKEINCFFCEKDPDAYAKLERLVERFDDPKSGFRVFTFEGEFENAVHLIPRQWGAQSFRLIFIDPTGWTGYPLEIVGPLLRERSTEVLVNFMYDYINRFNRSDDPKIIAQFDLILGGEGWKERLDPALPRGEAVQSLFKQALSDAGDFDHIASARIEKSTIDRPHFDIVFGTKSFAGLKNFREVEAAALKRHYPNRQAAKLRKQMDQDEADGQIGFFTPDEIQATDESYEHLVNSAKTDAVRIALSEVQSRSAIEFEELAKCVMESCPLKFTHVKDVCVSLERDGVIQNTWRDLNKRKPDSGVVIRLTREPITDA